VNETPQEPPRDDGGEIADAERAFLYKRRLAVGVDTDADGVGLALSGGGIRAATFSLGVLKSLSSLHLIHRFDYLSTVSGGGYTGSFYGSMFVAPELRGLNAAPGPELADLSDPLGSPRAERAIGHLRDNGRYLLPRGAGDAVRLATTAVRGWLSIHLVIGVTLIAVLLLAKAVQATLVGTSALRDLDGALAAGGWQPWASPLQWMMGYPKEAVQLSWLWPLVILLISACTAMAWAYWLAPYKRVSRWRFERFASVSAIATTAIAAICLGWPPKPETFTTVFRFVGGLAAAAVVVFVLAEVATALRDGRAASLAGPVARGSRRGDQDRVRNLITRWTSKTLTWAAAFAVMAVIDTIGQTFYALYLQGGSGSVVRPIIGGAISVALIPFARRVITWGQTKGATGVFLRRFGHLLALIAAAVLAFALATFWAIIAEYLAWRGGPIGTNHGLIGPVEDAVPLLSLWSLAGGFAVVSIGIGVSIGFLNLSSFSAFYAGRLRRAYLGASNTDRIERGVVADREDQGDEIQLADYYAPGTGAPLHLINITINETKGKESSIVQRDRKGRPLTLSPAGFLVPLDGTRRERIPLPASDDGASGDSELPLSSWVAISGAAMSTGLGRNTSLGLALLAGLSNLRLGVWWTRPGGKRWQPLDPRRWVQRYLAAEFLGRFSGIHGPRWYLTDGGHFENTGVYELVRRRVPLIVACDSGADPDYTFEDVVNLTRKLRIDFGADLDFLPSAELDLLLGPDAPNRGIFGELSQLVKLSRERSSRGPYAAIGRIRIAGDEDYLGTLILIKPRLSGLEMIDLLDYHRANQDFPQQSTGDQFFDEAQWESYYRLGTNLAELVFTSAPHMGPPPAPVSGRSKVLPAAPTRWEPAALEPISVQHFPWFAGAWQTPVAVPRDAGQVVADAPGDQADTRERGTGGDTEVGAPNATIADAVGVAASRIGTGKLITGVIASVAGLGLASGVGQSLATGAMPTAASVQGTRSATTNGDEGAPGDSGAAGDAGATGDEGTTGTAGATGSDGTPRAAADEETHRLLATVIERLGELTGRKGTGKPKYIWLTQEMPAIQLAFARYTDSRSEADLKALIAGMTAIKTDAAAHDQTLKDLASSLDKIAASIRENAPRRNVRGSQ